MSVEDFSASEAALILEVTESRIDELLKQASSEIGRQIATDVLIIEDEPLIAIDLQADAAAISAIASPRSPARTRMR